MKRIVVTFQIIDDDRKTVSLQQKSFFLLEPMSRVMNHDPLLAVAAHNEAKKFWESVVLMGYLEKN